MKKLPIVSLFGICLFAYLLIFSVQTFAAQFSTAYVRLDRLTPNTSLSGTICATPSSAGAGSEDSITITFPTDFTISTTASNWTTNTSSLPQGATAWPGIGNNASSVSNKSVTFDSSDLNNSSALYCFNFSSSNSETGSAGNNKEGIITTRNSSNSVIDTSEFALSVLSNDQIEVSATVPAQASDYINGITRVIPPLESTIISEGFDSLYQIRYGTNLTYPTSITVEASWTQGTIENQPSPTVELLEYVVGSSEDAYNSTPPVIDTVNRKITWEINSFPGNLDYETVRFKLRTRDYTEPHKVNYSVSSRIFFPGGVTAYKTLTSTYKKSVAPPSAISPTPTPTSASTLPLIESIQVTEISQDSVSIFINTSGLTTKTIRYGTSVNNLNKSITSPSSLGSVIKITDLEDSTNYFFRVYVRDSNGRQTVSDVYTFQTAKKSSPLLADPLSLVVSSGNTIITLVGNEKSNKLVMPIGAIFQFKFAMSNNFSANSVIATLRNKNVMGIFSNNNVLDANTESVKLIETENGVYSGNLMTSTIPGIYELYLKISDKNGNISEQKFADIKVINKLKISSSPDKKPIEGARVHVYIYNPTSKTYELIPPNILSGGNPIFSNANGEVNLILPQGKYKTEISEIRHKDKVVEFEIGPDPGQDFPHVELFKSEVSLLGLFNYYRRTINDVFILNTQAYSETLTGSTRFFDLISLLSLFGVVVLTIFAFSKRHRIPVSYIPSYFYYLLDRKDRNEKYIHGVVYDEDDLPISSANVYLTDKEEEKIISHTKTNKTGEFYFKRRGAKYLVMAMARNYINSPVFEYHPRKHLKFKINLKKEEHGLNLFHRIEHYFAHFLGLSFEVLLLVSFTFELLFLNTFGVAKTLPFLLISIFNLTLWILHLHNKSHSKVIF